MKIRPFAIWCALLASGGITPSFSAENESLRPLPSFEIFGFTPKHEKEALKEPYDVDAYEKEINAAIQYSRELESQSPPGAGQKPKPQNRFYIPIALMHLRPLYAQAQWSPEQRTLIEKTAAFLARDVGNPSLAVPVTDDAGARKALDTLSRWFLSYANEGDNLAHLIFTFDDGPFHGIPVSAAELARMKRIGTRSIPGRTANFAVWRDPRPRDGETIVIGVVGHDRKLLWARRLSGEKTGKVMEFEFTSRKPGALPGYGYLVDGMAGWTYGHESARFYLDQDLKLRFYFISW